MEIIAGFLMFALIQAVVVNTQKPSVVELDLGYRINQTSNSLLILSVFENIRLDIVKTQDTLVSFKKQFWADKWISLIQQAGQCLDQIFSDVSDTCRFRFHFLVQVIKTLGSEICEHFYKLFVYIRNWYTILWTNSATINLISAELSYTRIYSCLNRFLYSETNSAAVNLTLKALSYNLSKTANVFSCDLGTNLPAVCLTPKELSFNLMWSSVEIVPYLETK